jgi:hypothetical protein
MKPATDPFVTCQVPAKGPAGRRPAPVGSVNGRRSPASASQREPGRPFGAAARADRALPSLGIAALATAFLEPNPEVTWDEWRLAEAREELTHLRIGE